MLGLKKCRMIRWISIWIHIFFYLDLNLNVFLTLTSIHNFLTWTLIHSFLTWSLVYSFLIWTIMHNFLFRTYIHLQDFFLRSLENFCTWVCDKGNVALVLVLTTKSHVWKDGVVDQSHNNFIVSNTHKTYKKPDYNMKLLQTIQILHLLTNIKTKVEMGELSIARTSRLIIAEDLNS